MDAAIRKRRGHYWMVGLLWTGCQLHSVSEPDGGATVVRASRQHSAQTRSMSLPRRPGFEPNRGQWPPAVRFAARDGAVSVFLAPTEAVWAFERSASDTDTRRSAMRMRWKDANANPLIEVNAPNGVHVHRYHGRDGWQSDVPLYARATYRELYPGVDLAFHDDHGSLEYDFVVAPGANPDRIRFVVEGADVRVDERGDLRLGDELVQHAPVVYQQAGGERRLVSGSYVVASAANGAGTEISFAIGSYDRGQPLVIDPRVTNTTSVVDDGLYFVTGMALDLDRNIWLAGWTTSHTFPFTQDAPDKLFAQDEFDEGFALKLDPEGTLVYATYLGGTNTDGVGGLALDAAGNVFLAGTTISTNFPVTVGAYQADLASPGTEDNFLAKLDPDGRLLHATYFGGNGRDLFPGAGRGFPGAAVALGAAGSVYLAGGTGSTDLPTAGAYQRQFGGGTEDAFLARFTADLDFELCTYFGGSNTEGVFRAEVDGSGNVYLLGLAARILGASWSLPVTVGAYQTAPSGDPLPFVVKFDAGGGLVYATFLGPDAGDPSAFNYLADLAVDAAGNAYVVGVTEVGTYPTTPGAFRTTLNGFSDLYVSKLDPTGAALVYSTFFGGSQAEMANGAPGVGIAVDAGGNAYIIGHTSSLDLPQKDSFEPTTSGRFIAKLDPTGANLVYASYVRFQNMGLDAIALGPGPEGIGAGIATGNETVFIAGPTIDPRGFAVIGIDEKPAPCSGDCDGDGVVRVNELVMGVRIALDQAAVSTCPSFDQDGDGRVTVNELIRGVNALLRGCG